MKHIIPLLILAISLPLHASEPHWKHFVQEDTLLIAHVDLHKIDVTQALQNNAQIAETILATYGFNAAVSDRSRETLVQAFIPFAELGKKYLTDTLGIREAYIVVNLRFSAQTAVTVILPQSGTIKVETLKAGIALGLPNDTLKVVSTEDDRFIVIAGNGPDAITDEEWSRNLAQIIPPTPAERPDFAEAFRAVEGAPIQIAVALPDFSRKVIRDTAPRLSGPFSTLDIVTPLSSLRWKTVGIDPAASTLHITAAMMTELAATNTRHGLQEALTLYIQQGIKELEVLPDDFTIKSLLPILKNRADWIHSLLIPKQEGNNLVLHWEKPQFDEMLESAMPAITLLAQTEADRMQRQPCVNHMQQFALAFHNYHDSNGSFPPAYTVDDDGKPLHSWRVLVLPYIGQSGLYHSIRLDEPWDSEHNKQFHDKMPATFRCPVSSIGDPNRDTVYCMVVGTETIGVPDGKEMSFHGITDGTSNTILLVERKTPVCWMEPVDVLQAHAYLGVNQHADGLGSEHIGGVVVGFADGSVRFMREGIPLDVLKAFLTRAGGESVWASEFLEFAR
ncbi:MAG: DUF1559 domain-containing protein [Planctomycetaceae bacterium]|nr:DUF1559 domain-containing protein [Planctomycetaceae bacterium]